MNPEKRPTHNTEALKNFDQTDKIILSNPVFTEDPVLSGVIKRIILPQENLKEGTELHDTVARAVQETDKAQAMTMQRAAGIDIAASIIESATSPRARMLGYLNACHQIDRITVGLVKHLTNGESMNMIMHFMRQEIVGSLEPTTKTMQATDYLNETIRDVTEIDERNMGWFAPKMTLLFHDVQDIYHAALRLGGGTNSAEKPSETETFQLSHVLMAQAMQQRRYGLKPAYTAASIGGSWVFHDGYEVADTIDNDRTIDDMQSVPMAAMVLHTQDDTPKVLRLGKPETTIKGAGKTTQFEYNVAADMRLFWVKTANYTLTHSVAFGYAMSQR